MTYSRERRRRMTSSRSIRQLTLRPSRLAVLIGALLLSGCVGAMAPRFLLLVGVGPAIPGLVIWRLPQPGETFVIGADPAEGNPQSDNSAASVVDLAGAQVAAWAGRVEPAAFGAQIAAVSAFFNGAQALVERNNHGHAVLLWLREFSPVRALPGLDKKPGWATTGSSKPMAYDNAAEVLRAGGSGDSRSATRLRSWATSRRLGVRRMGCMMIGRRRTCWRWRRCASAAWGRWFRCRRFRPWT